MPSASKVAQVFLIAEASHKMPRLSKDMPLARPSDDEIVEDMSSSKPQLQRSRSEERRLLLSKSYTSYFGKLHKHSRSSESLPSISEQPGEGSMSTEVQCPWFMKRSSQTLDSNASTWSSPQSQSSARPKSNSRSRSGSTSNKRSKKEPCIATALPLHCTSSVIVVAGAFDAMEAEKVKTRRKMLHERNLESGLLSSAAGEWLAMGK
mmetsp:Transcript_105297/g.193122  ORF Transcript_105297/g.193122 Transcript_105297/m.193122 type:complete len:207 (-) Transcript_105297:167-787(-)